jgi:hypothetical protein
MYLYSIEMHQQGRTIRWRDPRFIHTGFLKELCSNNEYIRTYLITICLFQRMSNLLNLDFFFLFRFTLLEEAQKLGGRKNNNKVKLFLG